MYYLALSQSSLQFTVKVNVSDPQHDLFYLTAKDSSLNKRFQLKIWALQIVSVTKAAMTTADGISKIEFP
jgi:hypothetical protein